MLPNQLLYHPVLKVLHRLSAKIPLILAGFYTLQIATMEII
jgi:hypothetical protein